MIFPRPGYHPILAARLDKSIWIARQDPAGTIMKVDAQPAYVIIARTGDEDFYGCVEYSRRLKIEGYFYSISARNIKWRYLIKGAEFWRNGLVAIINNLGAFQTSPGYRSGSEAWFGGVYYFCGRRHITLRIS